MIVVSQWWIRQAAAMLPFRGSLLALALVGCATTPQTPAAAPLTPPPAPPPSAQAPPAPPPRGVPPAPERCRVFGDRKPGVAPECAEPAAARSKLLAALTTADASARDQSLVTLEACAGLPGGVVRALRAELAPPECGDVLVEPLLAAPPTGLRADVRDALTGLSLAARAHRLVRTPPQLAPPHDKERVQEFVKTTLFEWITDQAHAVHAIGVKGAALSGYGKGVVAVEAGLADLRFVDVARGAPIPDEMAKDQELSEAYYGSLDEALEPRKTRGRDAALVGLGALSSVGVLEDPRVNRARSLLSKLYAGRRIDALDNLLLPPLPPSSPKTVEQRLAHELPTFYAEILLSELDPRDPENLRPLLDRGLPPFARTRLEQGPKASAGLFARGLFELGRRYWLAKAFQETTTVAKKDKLLAALGQVLSKGPDNAAAMMLRGPTLPKLDVAPLDKLAAQPFATYDAARILEVAHPANAGADFWRDVAKRYERAAKQLEAAKLPQAKDATAAAKAATDTANALSSEAAADATQSAAGK